MEQAREQLESAREQLREAKRNYREAMKELRALQWPHSRLFSTERLFPEFPTLNEDLWASLDSIPHMWPMLEMRDGDASIFLGRGHWFPRGCFQSRMHLAMINSGLGQYFGTEQGVLVLNVSEDNIYQLQPGDVILSINGREPRDTGRVFELLRTYEPGEEITLSIMRNKKQQKLTSTIP